jgi:nucleoid DNA-binding protein
MIFEYVVSGASHALTTHDIFIKGKDDFLGYLTKFKQMLVDKGEYDFSFLYNGYMEAKMGKCLHNTFGESAKFYVDSGGLQMVTLGHTVTDELKAGGSITIAGFGTFAVSERAERQGRNPQTGATIEIAAGKVPAFKAGKALKDAVN